MKIVGRKLHATWQSQGLFHTKILGHLVKNTVYWCNLKQAQERGLLFYQKVACNSPLRHTTSCLHRESSMHEDEGWPTPNVRLTPRVPRVALKSNSQIGLRDQREQEARPTKRIKEFLGDWEPHHGLQNSWYTSFCSWTARFTSKIQSQKVDREVREPPEQRILPSRLQTEEREINEPSKKSQELIADMNKTEIFKLCETSSKQQCFDGNLYCWSRHCLLYVSCGRCLKISQSDKVVNRSNNDVVSIPGYVIKNNNKRGARHGPSERQRLYYKAQEMLHKAGQMEHGGHSSILARWHNDCEYRNSLSLIGWTEQDLMFCDRIALETHSYVATRAWENSKLRTLGSKLESGWCSATVKSTTRLCSSEKGMQETTRRARTPARIHRYSSQSTNKTAKRATIRGPRRIRLRRWPENRLEVLQTVAGKPADNFVKLAGQPASSFVIVVNAGPNPVEDEQLEFSAFFEPWRLVKFFQS